MLHTRTSTVLAATFSAVLAAGMLTAAAPAGTARAAGPTTARAAAVGTASTAPAPDGAYLGLAPARVLDTRTGVGASTAPVSPGGTLTLKVLGVGGVPATGVSAVVLNLTATGATGAGYVTAYPGGATRPVVSNLNFTAGATVQNMVIAKVGADGTVRLTNTGAGTVHLIADVSGYYLSSTTAAVPGSFASLAPSRVLDTRSGIGGPVGSVPAHGSVRLKVASVAGVPATGAGAVALNVTVANPRGTGYLSATPTGTTTTSNLNFVAGTNTANMVISKLGADGTLVLSNSSSAAIDLIADVAGYYRGGTVVTGTRAVDPVRILDTRTGIGAPKAKIPANSAIRVAVAGVGSIPTGGLDSAALNLTVVGAGASGFLSMYPSGSAKPNASVLNFAKGDVRPNLVIGKLGADGAVTIFNTSSAAVDVLADVVALATPAVNDGSVMLGPPTTALSKDVVNHSRGQYRWMSYPTQGGITAGSSYQRDRVYQGMINPKAGVYDFRQIDQWFSDAKSQGQDFGFRVMNYCPGCWMENSPYYPKAVPADLPVQPTKDALGGPIPDWNSPVFLARWDALMVELGKKYAPDPYLSWVEVGGYGSYGEMWLSAGGTPITFDNWKKLVASVARNFPRQHLFVQTMTDPAWTKWALDTYPNMGMRTDSLGADNMHSTIATTPALQGYWRTRPIISEFNGAGSTTMVRALAQARQYHVSMISSRNMPVPYASMTAAEQDAFLTASRTAGYRYAISSAKVSKLVAGQSGSVTLTIRNDGTAPTYDPHTVTGRLVNSSGAVVATFPIADVLRSILPGTSGSTTATLSVPAGVPAGQYTLTVRMTDRIGVVAFANETRQADGSYRVGTVAVGG